MKNNRKGKIKTGKLALFLLIVAAVLVILAMAIGKGVTYMMGKNGNSASPISYYLFIGTDKNWGNEADALLLTAWNSRDKEVTFLSIPPNTKLSRQEKKNQLIRSTFSEGGAEETKSAVENLLHIRVDGYGVVDFSDFEKTMDKIGGIDMYVEKNMEHVDGSGSPDIQIRQGYQDLTGSEALGYVRYLDGNNGEIDRIQRQERMMKLLVASLHTHFPMYNYILAHHLWNLEETDIPSGKAAQLAYTFTSYPEDSFRYVILPGETETINKVSTWVVNPAELQKAVALTIGSDNEK